jgi:hypothetical protein
VSPANQPTGSTIDPVIGDAERGNRFLTDFLTEFQFSQRRTIIPQLNPRAWRTGAEIQHGIHKEVQEEQEGSENVNHKGHEGHEENDV